MSEFSFLQTINDLANTHVTEETVLDLYSQAEDLFDDFKSDIRSLKEDLDDKSSEIEDLERAIRNLEKENDSLEEGFRIDLHQDNIITRSVVEDLFDNLDNIPIDKLQEFINQYKKQ